MKAQTDALTALEAKGHQLRQDTRERLFIALLADGDAALRTATAERIRDDGQAEMARLQASARAVARDAAQTHRARLFDLTTPGAHIRTDLAKRHYARQTAHDRAQKLKTQEAAGEALSGALRNPGAGEGMALIDAAAIAERCYDANWSDPLLTWLDTPWGVTRGGGQTLAKLDHAERIAGGGPLPALSDLASAAEMAGDHWPAAEAR